MRSRSSGVIEETLIEKGSKKHPHESAKGSKVLRSVQFWGSNQGFIFASLVGN